MQRKEERNNAVVSAYREGASISEVARTFGMSGSNVYRILELYDATPDWTDTLARMTRANRAKVTPEFREKVSRGTAAWWARRMGENGPVTCSEPGNSPVYGCRPMETEAA